MTDTDSCRDPAAFGPALAKLLLGVASNPIAALDVAVRAAVSAVDPDAGLLDGTKLGDRRFSDPEWQENAWFVAQRQAYTAWSQGMEDLVGISGLDDGDAEKVEFALARIADALAPTNFLWGNPAALRKAVETGGASVLDGLTNFLDDVVENRGKPRQVDASSFEVGGNLACTPGKVVYRNDLMEIIQYAPQTDTVHAVPLLMSPPWINRYYIMDLAPGRSFVEWAVAHGHITFAISYRNPDASMRGVGLDDYMQRGLGEAVDVVREITGAPKVNVAGLCVGGTLAVMLGAWLAPATQKGNGRGNHTGNCGTRARSTRRPCSTPSSTSPSPVILASSPTRWRSSGSRSAWPSRASSRAGSWPTRSTRSGPTT